MTCAYKIHCFTLLSALYHQVPWSVHMTLVVAMNVKHTHAFSQFTDKWKIQSDNSSTWSIVRNKKSFIPRRYYLDSVAVIYIFCARASRVDLGVMDRDSYIPSSTPWQMSDRNISKRCEILLDSVGRFWELRGWLLNGISSDPASLDSHNGDELLYQKMQYITVKPLH